MAPSSSNLFMFSLFSFLLIVLILVTSLVMQIISIGYRDISYQEIDSMNFLESMKDNDNYFVDDTLLFATSDYPPFIFSDERQFSLMTEIVTSMCDASGIKYDIVYVPWRRCTYMLDQGLAYGTYSFVETPARRKYYDFSTTIYTYEDPQTYIFYDSERIEFGNKKTLTYNDIKNYSIGLVAGYWYLQYFDEQNIDYILHANEYLPFEKLNNGYIDIVAAEYIVGKFYLNSIDQSTTSIKALPINIDQTIYTDHKIMVKLNNPINQVILPELKIGLDRIKDNTHYDTIIDEFNRLVE